MAGNEPEPQDSRSLGRLLRSQREAQGLSQERLAVKAGLSIRTVRNLEAGRGRPHAATVERLLGVLQVDEGTAGLLAGPRRPELADAGAQNPDHPSRFRPAELPADIIAFTGRHTQLEALDAQLLPLPDARASDPLPGKGTYRSNVALIVGAAGVGKTSLAVRWAHRTCARWPDGQIFVDLRGHDTQNPVQPDEALAHLLRSLGVPEPEWPVGTDSRAALLRSTIANRRALVILDNCASADQARPLLPGTTSSAVVITSRHSLSGLVARDGASRIRVDSLDLDDAVLLLRRLLGEGPPHEALADLAQLCDRLPLALRIAAELVSRRTPRSVQELVAELKQHRRLLPQLSNADDGRTDLPTVFSWSLKHLPEAAKTSFVAIGLHPGPTFDKHLLSTLTGAPSTDVSVALRALEDAHLIIPDDDDRWRTHDLVREYAQSLTPDTDDMRRAAARQLMGFFADAAEAAENTLFGGGAREVRDAAGPALSTPADALRWLSAERDNIEACVRLFADQEPQAAITLSRHLFRYLAGNDARLALTVHTNALRAAERLEDPTAVVSCLNNLGTALWQSGEIQAAEQHFQRALAVARDTGNLIGEGQTLIALGRCEQKMTAAAEWFAAALVIFEKLDDLNGQARCLANLGFAQERLGELGTALGHLTRAAALAAASADHGLEANILGGMGEIARREGDYTAALHHHQRALDVFRQLGDRERSAWALHSVGTDLRETEALTEAASRERESLELFEELGDPTGQAHALNGLGETLLALDDFEEARGCFDQVLELGEVVGDRDQLARAHAGAMHVASRLENLDAARTHGSRALSIYSELGRPEANEVKTALRALALPRPK